MVMKNGEAIRRNPGESLVQAAERIAAGNAPRVMFGILDPMMDRQKAVQNFYQEYEQRARIIEVHSGQESSAEEEGGCMSSDEEELSELTDTFDEIGLSTPTVTYANLPYVQNAERTVPSTRTARKEVFDGVYPLNREKAKNRIREIVEKKHDNNKETRNEAQPSVTVPTDQLRPVEKSPNLEAGKMRASRKSASMDMVPEVIPIEAR
jgi:hypothetical protein